MINDALSIKTARQIVIKRNIRPLTAFLKTSLEEV